MFALRPDDEVEAFYDKAIDIDEGRYKVACDNLARVEIVGFQHRHGEFVDALVQRCGWTRANVKALRVSDPAEVSEALRRRITEDSAADIAFYEHALAHPRVTGQRATGVGWRLAITGRHGSRSRPIMSSSLAMSSRKYGYSSRRWARSSGR